MAARSFFITVNNWTGRVWNRTNLGLAHGIWSNNDASIPPEQMPRFSTGSDGDPMPGTVHFESESNGFAVGTEGFVDYTSDRGEVLHIYWNNPYIGSNGFSVTVPSDTFLADWGNISGNNANVTVDIRRHP